MLISQKETTSESIRLLLLIAGMKNPMCSASLSLAISGINRFESGNIMTLKMGVLVQGRDSLSARHRISGWCHTKSFIRSFIYFTRCGRKHIVIYIFLHEQLSVLRWQLVLTELMALSPLWRRFCAVLVLRREREGFLLPGTMQRSLSLVTPRVNSWNSAASATTPPFPHQASYQFFTDKSRLSFWPRRES